MSAYLLVMLVAAAVTYLATPVARRVAERTGAMTPLRDRDVHSVPTPRLGGLAMFAGLVASFVVGDAIPFFDPIFDSAQGPWGILAAAGLVALIGVLDDIWNLDSITKLAGQVLAAGVLAWQGVQLVTLPLGGVTVGSGGLFLFLTITAVVVTINAVNFIDGLDGLAAGVMAIAGGAFFIYTYMLTREASRDDYSSLAAIIVVAMVGCCLGFLPHNIHPARIFMGDSGAMQLGLLLAASAIAVTGQVDPAVVSDARLVPAFFPVLLPLAVLVVPLADLLLAVVRRVRAGQSPFVADRQHLHHRLLDLGHSHLRAVGVMYLWTAVISFGAISGGFIPLRVWLSSWLALALVALALTLGPLGLGRGVGRGVGRFGRRREAEAPARRQAVPVPPPPRVDEPLKSDESLRTDPAERL
jgi:UDP-GlcNAc:undecaprenyl-phosphate GlcNAc-1-phosphate transferase